MFSLNGQNDFLNLIKSLLGIRTEKKSIKTFGKRERKF